MSSFRAPLPPPISRKVEPSSSSANTIRSSSGSSSSTISSSYLPSTTTTSQSTSSRPSSSARVSYSSSNSTKSYAMPTASSLSRSTTSYTASTTSTTNRQPTTSVYGKSSALARPSSSTSRYATGTISTAKTTSNSSIPSHYPNLASLSSSSYSYLQRQPSLSSTTTTTTTTSSSSRPRTSISSTGSSSTYTTSIPTTSYNYATYTTTSSSASSSASASTRSSTLKRSYEDQMEVEPTRTSSTYDYSVGHKRTRVSQDHDAIKRVSYSSSSTSSSSSTTSSTTARKRPAAPHSQYAKYRFAQPTESSIRRQKEVAATSSSSSSIPTTSSSIPPASSSAPSAPSSSTTSTRLSLKASDLLRQSIRNSFSKNQIPITSSSTATSSSSDIINSSSTRPRSHLPTPDVSVEIDETTQNAANRRAITAKVMMAPMKTTSHRRMDQLSSLANKTADDNKQQPNQQTTRYPSFDAKRITFVGVNSVEAGERKIVEEYADDVFVYYVKVLEPMYTPNASYINHQTEITWKHRRTLIDWINQVHTQFQLKEETFYLSVNIMDRFLSARNVSLSKFQLVGLVSILIACKYEEVVVPTMKDLEWVSDSCASPQDLRAAEMYVLGALNWNIGFPSPLHYLRRLSKADNHDVVLRNLCKYFVEVWCMDEGALNVPWSALVAGSVFVAKKLLHAVRPFTYRGEWSPAHIQLSGYTEDAVTYIGKRLVDLLVDKSRQGQVCVKYSSMPTALPTIHGLPPAVLCWEYLKAIGRVK